MDANDWFANAAGDPRAPEHHNDFGGFLGGPIWKDKTFFFFSYEGARLDLPRTTVTQVPSEYARTTAVAAIVPYLNAYPLPNDQAVTPGVYTSPFTGNYADRATLMRQVLGSTTPSATDSQSFGRYNYAPSQIVGPSAGGFSLSHRSDYLGEHTDTDAGVNMVRSPRLSNTIRGNYSMQRSGQILHHEFVWGCDSA